LENNGGFASIRTPFANFDLSAYTKLIIRYRSSGQHFAFTLSNFKRFYQPKFKAGLPNTDGVWKTIELRLADFERMRLSQVLSGKPNQDTLSTVIRLGIISADKKAGPYQLEIDFIEFS